MNAIPHTMTPKSLVLAEVGAFWQGLLAQIDRGPVVLDLSQLERLDGAGAQLLAVAVYQGQTRGISVVHPSPTTVDLARALGLELLANLD